MESLSPALALLLSLFAMASKTENDKWHVKTNKTLSRENAFGTIIDQLDEKANSTHTSKETKEKLSQ
ncbi:hypothetical protein M5D96_011247 [Drosophila gunungcola]|uniref:Male accessory gland secretory protein n=1 Tax=Drosophila gunungcola TaxID=103775 RepID=A0A9P9YF29_9MUSC|nr:hypothetical protein M5D96_011247 [Drosophila gunungcola]